MKTKPEQLAHAKVIGKNFGIYRGARYMRLMGFSLEAALWNMLRKVRSERFTRPD
jgi:hypothetical protein